MRSKKLWIINNDSEMTLCNELRKLNRLANSATCLAKLKSSKHQEVRILYNSLIKHVNEPVHESK